MTPANTVPSTPQPTPRIIRTCEPLLCCDEVWENAYLRFETAEEEIAKFLKRLIRLGAEKWSREAQIVEIFCGRGNGLISLQRMGFKNLEGVDLSERLLLQFGGEATLYVADCRKLPFADSSRDVLIVQGGLHHLPTIPEDLILTLKDCHRVLRPGGRMVLVEPWMTPFLKTVHLISELPILRKMWGKLDALATMTEREHDTYYNWHAHQADVDRALTETFTTELREVRYGKLYFVGVKS